MTPHGEVDLVSTVDVSPSDSLEIDDLSKRYGDVTALSHMTFDVRAGEIFGFVGSNGAGKTTTMRIASPTPGRVSRRSAVPRPAAGTGRRPASPRS